jgi:hypothetical protein
MLDLYDDVAGPTVLMWHGAQTDARGAMRPLAELVADHGLAVVVPDWNSHADDGSAAALRSSLELLGTVQPNVIISSAFGGDTAIETLGDGRWSVCVAEALASVPS